MDEHMHAWGHAIAKLPLAPSEYFRRQCFVSCDPNERTLPSVVALAGEDVVLFATDYPHPDALTGDLVACIAEQPGLTATAREKILRGNAQRCFRLA